MKSVVTGGWHCIRLVTGADYSAHVILHSPKFRSNFVEKIIHPGIVGVTVTYLDTQTMHLAYQLPHTFIWFASPNSVYGSLSTVTRSCEHAMIHYAVEAFHNLVGAHVGLIPLCHEELGEVWITNE